METVKNTQNMKKQKTQYFTFAKKRYKKDALFWGLIFVAPTMLGLFFLNIKPMFETIFMSFQQSSGLGASQWVGWENYERLIHDENIPLAIWNTIRYSLIVVPGTIVFSLLAAELLNQKIKGISFYRVIYFLPVVATPAAIAMVWKWLYNSDYGLINHALSLIGIKGPAWLTDPQLTIIAIAIVGIWSAIGTNMVILIAGFQEIPRDYYESSSLEGAGPIRQFFSITLPLVSPALFFVCVTTVINSLQIFDVIYMMFSPTSEVIPYTQTLVYLFFKHAFILNEKGYGATIILILLLIIGLLTYIQMKLQKKWVHY
ncbi:sugar ABC transporter permease [Lederbergia sp. NSJ-179]|uniref:carbohydrate ABC transporter permease n=1 Tax=Lederbergia sp. NSJ-179 TaxID=2931402 RepID=UPI001FD449B7|nr:sugar ABC transporter permease [Lederbergia sp. NSJ-179]MCJ7842316.1 sugar ABC transporter permease [Lederbergia sp. NSJ-179]